MKNENKEFKSALPEDPFRWFMISQEIFMSPKWERRLNRVANIHPDAIRYIDTGVKDSGMELTSEQRKAVAKIRQESRVYHALQDNLCK